MTTGTRTSWNLVACLVGGMALGLPTTSWAEWLPNDVLGRVDPSLQSALLPDGGAGPLDDDEQAALASAISFIPPELWYSSAIKVPLRPVSSEGQCGAAVAQRRATLYIVEYISRTYGMVVVRDIPNALYSVWVESPTESPLTGRKVLPLFYYSDGGNADAITAMTPARDLLGGPMEGLGDNGTGGLDADNGFSATNGGIGYWPMYLRGYLTSGAIIPYNTIPFGAAVRSVLSAEEQSQILPQTFNYLHTPSNVLLKVACHSDGALHGWVPGDPGQFEVRFELPASRIANAVPAQARKMRRDNEFGESGGIVWPTRGTVPPVPDEYPLMCVASPDPAPTPDPNPSPGPNTIFINAGGPAYTDSTGTTFEADHSFVAGRQYRTSAAISGTVDDTLYQSERWANNNSFAYNVSVDNGDYMLTLKFAEIVFTAENVRVFDVFVEGQPAINALDVFAEVGLNAAYDVSLPVSVDDGVLNIDFESISRQAMVMGIVIAPL